jgi:hypothetical protein
LASAAGRQQLVNEPGFPVPVAVLDMGKVWDGAQVRKWAKGYARKR